jgi:hypothetical protein
VKNTLLEYYPNKVKSKSKNVNRGMHWIGNLDGYGIQLCVWSGLAHLHIHPNKDAELEMLPHAYLTDTAWDPFVECKNDEAWGVKPYDPNVTGFWSLVCPFRTENTQICAEMLGGEEFEDINLLGAPIIKLRHDSDGTSKHIRTQQDSAYQDKAKPSSVFSPDDLVCRTSIMDQKYGKPVLARLVKLIKEHQCNMYKIRSGFSYCSTCMLINRK